MEPLANHILPTSASETDTSASACGCRISPRRRPFVVGLSNDRRAAQDDSACVRGVAVASAVLGWGYLQRLRLMRQPRLDASVSRSLARRPRGTSTGSAGGDRCSSTKAAASAPRAAPPLTAELDDWEQRGARAAAAQPRYRNEAIAGVDDRARQLPLRTTSGRSRLKREIPALTRVAEARGGPTRGACPSSAAVATASDSRRLLVALGARANGPGSMGERRG